MTRAQAIGNVPDSNLVRAGLLTGSALLAFAAMWASFLIGALLLILLATSTVGSERRAATFAALSTLTLMIFTLFKAPEGDEFYYLLYLDRLRGSDEGYLRNDVFSIRPTEPLFIAYSWLAAQLNYGKILFVVGLIAIVYGGASASYIAIARHLRVNIIPILAFTFLLSVNIFGAAQLMRQYMSIGLASFALYFIVAQRFRMAGLAVLVGALVHNSTAVLLLPVLAALTIKRRPVITMGALALIAVVGFVYFSRQEVTFVAATDTERWMAAFSKDDGSVPPYLIALDVGLALALLFAWLKNGREDLPLQSTTGFCTALAAILLAISDQSLLFLRTYVIVEFVRPLAILILLRQLRLVNDPVTSMMLILVGAAMFFLRLSNLVFDYGGNPDDIFAIGIEQLIDRVIGFNMF